METASALASIAAQARAIGPPPILFYDQCRAAILGDRLLLFSPQEYTLLRVLCDAATAGVQSPAALAARLGGRTSPLAVRVLVCRLRRRLAERGVLGFVQNIRAQGYSVTTAAL